MMQKLALAYTRRSPLHLGKGLLAKRALPLPGPATQSFTAADGNRWRLRLDDHVMRNIFLFGQYEANTFQHLRRLAAPDMNFIDVGANIGAYTIPMARLLTRGSVIAFEPHPLAQASLRQHVEINNLANVEIVPMGLSDHDGTITLGHQTGNLGGASAFRAVAENQAEAPVTTLDEHFKHKPASRIDLIKVDIEGGEYKFLQGARRTLDNAPRLVLVMECIESVCRRAGYAAQELFDYVVELGFVPHLPRSWPRPLQRIARLPEGYSDNIIFIRR